MGTGFSKRKKQARAFQEQLSKMQSQMQQAEAVGTAGNGLVTVVLSGQGELKSLKIKPECVDPEDIEGLEDLIKAAFNDAHKKLNEEQAQNIPPGMPNLGAFGI